MNKIKNPNLLFTKSYPGRNCQNAEHYRCTSGDLGREVRSVEGDKFWWECTCDCHEKTTEMIENLDNIENSGQEKRCPICETTVTNCECPRCLNCNKRLAASEVNKCAECIEECPGCGELVEDGWEICSDCGECQYPTDENEQCCVCYANKCIDDGHNFPEIIVTMRIDYDGEILNTNLYAGSVNCENGCGSTIEIDSIRGTMLDIES